MGIYYVPIRLMFILYRCLYIFFSLIIAYGLYLHMILLKNKKIKLCSICTIIAYTYMFERVKQ